jgi:hypothetical protein
MPKAGREYEDLVGAVERALDPGAVVKVGQWIEGPDCRRDLDVEVRGCVDGKSLFVIVECKDRKAPVGIKVIDELESKRRDLGADRSIVYSNSGFTLHALRKAARVGIETASALKRGDSLVRPVIQRVVIAKRLSVERFSLRLFPTPEYEHEEQGHWMPADLSLDGTAVQNWVADLSARLLRDHEGVATVRYRCALKHADGWALCGRSIGLRGLDVVLECRKSWLAQTVSVDLSLGKYDHARTTVLVPANESYMLGPFDNHAWEEVSEGWTQEELAPNSFELRLTLLNPVRKIGGETPNVDELIAEAVVTAAP